ncbi:hypothetical protein SAZ10_00475 [Mesorhizobium sp. BAC0120]|uniref:hypothetical protein n=1 Tax=Mesorhizobium sp. BAC0120 TaxID=3090670 RepID=UPI00298C0840|nr:hypothetical protein [Mesorhizobium sp. BAC0120]MDW6020230.1 hypothetical protein [Mesorhizobium sp. BAC0120]
MQLKPGSFCPLLKKDCVGLQCSWFTKVQGKDMNTGKDVEEWGCAISFLPLLLVENSGQQRQTGAAVESFRNEMVKANEATQQTLFRQLASSLPPLPADAPRLISK